MIDTIISLPFRGIKNLTFWLTLLAIANMLIGEKIVHSQTYQPSNRTPVADNTLGTQVTGNGNNFTITGGLNKGQTLFHSFTDFSVPANGQANFLNPVGNRDIITRVTGNLFSDINGLVNTNGANFFLINPSGVVFGPNAQLNVGRAFMASTASGIDLVDGGGRIFTFGTNGNGDAPLLTVNSDVLFNPARLIMAGGSGQITNFGTLQTTNPGQYIGLIGGNVTIDGRYGQGEIIAEGGRVDLGGLNAVGTVRVDNNGLLFGDNRLKLSDIFITNGAEITVRANQTLDIVSTFFNNASSPGSNININANNLQIVNNLNTANNTQSNLYAGFLKDSGVKTAPADNININLKGKLILNYGGIYNTIDSGVEGRIGSIKINAESLDLKNQSRISTATLGKGDGGNIDIITKGNLTISGTDDPSLIGRSDGTSLSYIISSTGGVGDGGQIKINTNKGKLFLTNRGGIVNTIDSNGVGGMNPDNNNGITINAGEVEIINQSTINTTVQPQGKGKGRDIKITTTEDLAISNLSNINSSSAGIGDGGKITINTNNAKLSLANQSIISSGIQATGVGNSGKINIKAGELSIDNASFISTSTLQTKNEKDKGNAGDIEINTTGDIKISGFNPQSINPNIPKIAAIDSSTYGQGNAGLIKIKTQGKLSVENFGQIYSAISEKAVGNSKGISITAKDLSLKNVSIIATAAVGNGKAGNIDIKAQGGTIEFVDISGTAAAANSKGESGNILITGDRLLLNRGTIISNAESVSGGDIILTISDKILMRNGSRIATDSASIQKNGKGGNININSPLIVATPGNNDITANAYQGKGGRVNITSEGLFGIQKRDRESPFTNDITASSQFNQQGTVDINTPGTDPGRDSTELPNTTTDASNQISQVCSASTRDNKLTVTGRGGLPENAYEPLNSDVVWQDPRAVKPQPTVSKATTNTETLPPPAVGWVFDGKGKVTLVAAGTPGLPGTKIVCPK